MRMSIKNSMSIVESYGCKTLVAKVEDSSGTQRKVNFRR
jgi:hypothetical protein